MAVTRLSCPPDGPCRNVGIVRSDGTLDPVGRFALASFGDNGVSNSDVEITAIDPDVFDGDTSGAFTGGETGGGSVNDFFSGVNNLIGGLATTAINGANALTGVRKAIDGPTIAPQATATKPIDTQTLVLIGAGLVALIIATR
jgi:hypothetical protein